MSAAALLGRCHELGVVLWTEGESLKYDAPRGCLDSGLRSQLVAHKAGLIAILSAPPPPPPSPRESDDFDAQLAAFELRAAAIRDRQGVPLPEAERLAYREMIDRLDGAGPPPPRTVSWDELAPLRWGPAVGDPTPGIVIDRPDRERMRAAMRAAAAHPDTYAIAEREAIRSESEPVPPLLNDRPGMAIQFLMVLLQVQPTPYPVVVRAAAEAGVSLGLVLVAATQLEVIKAVVDGEEIWDLEQGRVR